MGSCSRCHVRDMVLKYKDVIEIEMEDVYEIYRKGKDRVQSTCIVHNGETYHWIMGVYSKNHSLDEDCTFSYAPEKLPKNGYPTVVTDFEFYKKG